MEVDHFDRKISTQTKATYLFLDRNFRKFWYNGKHPILFLMPESRSLSGGDFLPFERNGRRVDVQTWTVTGE